MRISSSFGGALFSILWIATGSPTAVRAQATSRPTSLPTTQVSLNFENVPVVSVLNQLSKDYGFQIAINEASSDTRVTIISHKPISAEDALSLLNAALRPKEYAVIRMGLILKVLTRTHAKQEPPVFYGVDVDTIPDNDDLRTQVMPVGALDAVKLRQDLTPMLTDTGANVMANAASNALVVTNPASSIRRVATIINNLNQRRTASTTLRVVRLRYADAEAAARLITTLFGTSETTQAGGATGARGGRGGPGGGGPGGFSGPQGFPGGPPGFAGASGGGNSTSGDAAAQAKISAAADQRTNTVVVTGPPDDLATIVAMLNDIDSNPSSEQAFIYYAVKNGQAADMAATLNGLFQQTGASQTSRTNSSRTTSTNSRTNSGFGNTNTNSGRGGNGNTGFGNTGFGNAGGNFGNNTGFGGANNAFGANNGRGGATSATSGTASLVGQVFVVADQDTNALLVTTASKYEQQVRDLIAHLDRPVPQVLIKVLVAEVTHDNNADFGADFSFLNARANGNGQSIGQAFGAPTSGLVVNILENNLNATLHALAQQNKLDVLSRPYILASDNQEAYVMVGQQVPIVTSNTTTALGQTVSQYQYQSVGIILDVTPHINPEGVVTLQVSPEISQLTSQTVTVGPGVSVPVIASRQASSIVAIKDGETIVIGGLMQDQKTLTVNKIPILGDIPIIGRIFGRTQVDKTKTELLLFLTPHVAAEPGLLKTMSTDEMKSTKLTPNAVAPGTFDDHIRGMQRGTTRPAR